MRPLYPEEVEPLPNITHTRPAYGEFTVPGVYMFHDIDFNRTYIGSANNLSARWCKHENELLRGIHHNRQLQQAFDHGADFYLSYLLTDSHSEALEIEQQLIDQYYDTGLIYNVARNVVLPALGTVRSEEAKAKQRAFYEREGVREATSDRIRLSWQDETVRANRLNGQRKEESRMKVGDRSRKNWSDPEIRDRLMAHRQSDAHRDNIRRVMSKPVTIDGVSYSSIKVAAEALGIKRPTLAWRIRNNRDPLTAKRL